MLNVTCLTHPTTIKRIDNAMREAVTFSRQFSAENGEPRVGCSKTCTIGNHLLIAYYHPQQCTKHLPSGFSFDLYDSRGEHFKLDLNSTEKVLAALRVACPPEPEQLTIPPFLQRQAI